MRHVHRAGLVAGVVLGLAAGAASAQEPKSGGILKMATRGEPGSYDCAAGTSITTLQYIAPHYSTLLRVDQDDYPTVVPDAGASWEISDDLKTYTVTLHDGIKFHDGTTLDSEDVRATFERMAHPPEGVVSARQSAFADVTAIEAVDPLTVRFTLGAPSSGFLATLASPWNCIYSAELLASNPDYPSKVVMGSGPFVFDEYQTGAFWKGHKFADYFMEGKPYLDGFEALIVEGPAVVNSLASGQVDANLRLISVPDQNRIAEARGDGVVFQSTPSTSVTLLVINTTRPPFDDVRVRRALSLAIDRDTGTRVLGDIASQRWSHIIFREGHEYAPSGEEKAAYPGFSPDIEANRAEARRLLEEAGQSDLSFVLLNRNLPVPYEPLAVFFIDQWRQIGVNVTQDPQDTAGWSSRLRELNYDVAIDLNAPSSDDATEVLFKYVPGSSINTTGIQDDELVRLYNEQNQTLDEAKRAELIRAFVDRAVDLQYFIPTFNAERLVALDARLKGWQVPPSFLVGLDLGNIWIDG